MFEDEFGMNGRHDEIGSRYTDNQFKGRVLEFIRNHEKLHVTLENDVGNNQKTIFYVMGGLSLALITKQFGFW